MVTSTDTISNAVAAQQAGSGSAAASQRLSGDLEDFLKLLTTQLKNQDPTQPLDANDFTQQIVALSGVEQQINTNKNLENMVALFSQQQSASLVNYIGKFVEAEGNKGYFDGENVFFAYDLPQEASEVEVSISDEAGNVVFAGYGTQEAGRNLVYWDGINSFTSAQMKAGIYQITVHAKDIGGQEMEPQTYTSGVVTAIDTQDGESKLMLGTIPMDVEDVLAIRQS